MPFGHRHRVRRRLALRARSRRAAAAVPRSARRYGERVVQLTPVSLLDVRPRLVVGKRGLVGQWCSRGPRWSGGSLLGENAQRQAQRHGRREPRKNDFHETKTSEIPTRRSAHAHALNARAPSGLYRRPCWVRCFVVAVQDRLAQSSEARRQRVTMAQSLRLLKAKRRLARWAWASANRTRRTCCTCPGQRQRRSGRAVAGCFPHAHAHGRARATTKIHHAPHESQPQAPTSASRPWPPRCRTAGTAWQLPSRPS